MSFARDLIYSFVNKRGDEMARFGPPELYHKMIEAGTDDDDYLHGLLNQVEDDRAHAEADRIRKEANETADAWSSEVQRGNAERSSGAMHYVADMIDPYEKRDDGQLYRKSDGKLIEGLKPGERRHARSGD